ncbi:MAG: YjjG family noncanonical pyrimidine nucleotidase [Melioribacteraceae bacterium]|nr:YjjG family noncanonical pyrimidine nucleotidase [Melioribacteraceae bacterium]
MKYKVALFDADGTLFDYDKAELEALQDTCEFLQLECSINFIELYKKFNSGVWRDFESKKIDTQTLRWKRFQLLFDELKIDIDPKYVSTLYLDYLSQKSYLFDGAEELIKNLYQRIKMSIITNGISEVQRRRIGLSAINNFFDHIIISDEVGSPKPESMIFEKTLKFYKGIEKNNVIIIGDNLESDIRGGINFGIDTCWFNPNKIENDSGIDANFEISDIRECLEIIY